MNKDIDLYIDLPVGYLAEEKYLCANASPSRLCDGFDRYRITISLDSKYFESPIKGVAPVKALAKIDDNN